MKRFAVLVLILMISLSAALAELSWPVLATPGQEVLKDYVERVNENLAAQGITPVNSIFELYSGFATMGITAYADAEVAESVEMTFLLNAEQVTSLQLRVSDKNRFIAIASACIQAASPDLTLEEAQQEPAAYIRQILAAPYTAFETEVITTVGDAPRTYYAYYPNQFSNGVDWLQLTLVFARLGSSAAPVMVTPPPLPSRDDDVEYGKNTFTDDYTHYEVFLSPTPEPDSAAME